MSSDRYDLGGPPPAQRRETDGQVASTTAAHPFDPAAFRILRSGLTERIHPGSPSLDVARGDPAEQVLDLLTSSAYRKGSLERMRFADCRAGMLAALQRCVANGAPVQVTLMAFPFKVPNPAKVGSRTLPDLAELVAILRCCALRMAIEVVYPPGLELHLLHDGPLISDVFGVDVSEVRRYEGYLRHLIRAVGADDFIRCHDFEEVQRRCGCDTGSAAEDLRAEALRWWHAARHTHEWRVCFRKTLGMLNLRTLPAPQAARLLREAETGTLPAEFAELEQRAHQAMVEYWVRDAIIHRFDPRPACFPDAVHATTRERPGRLALWLVRRGRGLLPWHGVGLVDGRGQVSVVHAEHAMARPHMRPVALGDEDTPFLYADRDVPLDLA